VAAGAALKSTASQGILISYWAEVFPVAAQPTASRSLSYSSVFVFAGGVLSLLPALSLSPYDTPTPLPGEANLEALRMRVL
jgi:hypothetical protein